MLTRDNLQRRNHVELSSQQRRLRHLTSISARNITPRKCFSNLNVLGTYFTLHLKNEAFYTSEIKNSFNPTWQSFDTRQISEDLNTSSSCITVRIWGGERGHFTLLIEWNVDLRGLSYLGDTIKQDGDSYEPNSIIFGLQDGFYVAPKQTEDMIENESNIRSSLLKVDQELARNRQFNTRKRRLNRKEVRSSYSLSSLHRLHTLVRAIRQTQLQIRQIKASVQENLNVTKHHILQASEFDRLKLSVNMLREELQKHRKTLTIERKKEHELSDQVTVKGEELQKRQDGFENVKKNFDEARKTYIAKRETLMKTNALLLMRRKQLSHELTYIYPIEELASKETVVCGLSLPNSQSQEFGVADEETLSGALGYVCHMVAMIGKFFQVPLRYPATIKGSRSTVSDFVNDRLPNREREFPLFIRGKEKCQFEFGVFLLNKNIAQIRFCLGLSTADLRLTLPNMKNLFDTKFGGSSPYRSMPINVITRTVSPITDRPTPNEKRDMEKPSIAPKNDNQESMETEELCLGEIQPNEEYILSHTNGSASESLLSSKAQATKHKVLISGQRKSYSSNIVVGTKKEKPKTEQGRRGIMANRGQNVEKSVEEMCKDGLCLQKERQEIINPNEGHLNFEEAEGTQRTGEETTLAFAKSVQVEKDEYDRESVSNVKR